MLYCNGEISRHLRLTERGCPPASPPKLPTASAPLLSLSHTPWVPAFHPSEVKCREEQAPPHTHHPTTPTIPALFYPLPTAASGSSPSFVSAESYFWPQLSRYPPSPAPSPIIPTSLQATPEPRANFRNPQPSTLNPQPSTLNPQPPTLNPQRLTLNPKPSTLNT